MSNICRICFIDDGILILPCKCKDGYIHKTCLYTWQTYKTDSKFCEVCKEPYNIVTFEILLGDILSNLLFYIMVINIFYLYCGMLFDAMLNFKDVFDLYKYGIITTHTLYTGIKFLILLRDLFLKNMILRDKEFLLRIIDIFIPFTCILIN